MATQQNQKKSSNATLSWLLIAVGIVGIIITCIIAAAFVTETIEYTSSKEKLTVEATVTEVEHITIDPNANTVTEYGEKPDYADRVRDEYDVTWTYEVHGEPYTFTERLSYRPEDEVTNIEVYRDSRGHYVRYAGGGAWTGIGIGIGVVGLLAGGFFIYLGADDLIKRLKKKKNGEQKTDSQ